MTSWKKEEFRCRLAARFTQVAAGAFAAASARIAEAVPNVTTTPPKRAMKTYRIPHTDLVVSRLAYGCGRLARGDQQPMSADEAATAARIIHTAYDNGITLFDHADVYGFGKAEELFGKVLKQSPRLREKIVIQSKCGQRFPAGWQPGQPIRVDLSRAHIVRAVEGSLRRLGTDRLDLLLLHAPDALVEPQEVAQAFEALHRSGKVRYFGVSNYTAMQIQQLRKSVRQPLVVNQIRLGLAYSYPLAEGLEFTLQLAQGTLSHQGYTGVAGGNTIEYCGLHDIQVQAWAPLRGLLNVPADAKPRLKDTAERLAALAKEKATTPAALALAWLLRHPAGIVPVIGATNPKHIVENCAADRVTLSREEWYDLFAAAAELPSRAI